MAKGAILFLVAWAFVAACAGLTYWRNRIPDEQKNQLFSIALILTWAVFLLGLYLYPYLVG